MLNILRLHVKVYASAVKNIITLASKTYISSTVATTTLTSTGTVATTKTRTVTLWYLAKPLYQMLASSLS